MGGLGNADKKESGLCVVVEKGLRDKDYGGGGWEEKRIGREKVMRRWGRG